MKHQQADDFPLHALIAYLYQHAKKVQSHSLGLVGFNHYLLIGELYFVLFVWR